MIFMWQSGGAAGKQFMGKLPGYPLLSSKEHCKRTGRRDLGGNLRSCWHLVNEATKSLAWNPKTGHNQAMKTSYLIFGVCWENQTQSQFRRTKLNLRYHGPPLMNAIGHPAISGA